jgi:hypothetical protein
MVLGQGFWFALGWVRQPGSIFEHRIQIVERSGIESLLK